ncbi:MarR family winged helix-turn-helix transcriptional regulator [Rhodovulum sp. DZ06]|uniref:MarR family winged helix-turn-helix transcriptional regulator n=1 Tax=Rhodovulum sp. DZ06 TaxID=3425126 RepID=UPI003D33311C
MKIDSYFPYRLVNLARAVDESMNAVHAARFGLCADEWRVLSAAAEADPAPTREIARLAELDKVAISRAASKLEERGLIRRHEAREDRRIKIIHLTEAGREMVADADRIVREREAWLLEGLDASERAVVDGLIDKLSVRAEELREEKNKTRCRPDCTGACEALPGMVMELERAMAI